MITTQLHYPGDPPQIVFLMFGREFIESVRNGKPAEITLDIYGDEFKWERAETIKISEIICDQCGGKIGLEEPLAFTGIPSKVYCWPCHQNLNGPHLVRKE